jgi:hypothetical protein
MARRDDDRTINPRRDDDRVIDPRSDDLWTLDAGPVDDFRSRDRARYNDLWTHVGARRSLAVRSGTLDGAALGLGPIGTVALAAALALFRKRRCRRDRQRDDDRRGSEDRMEPHGNPLPPELPGDTGLHRKALAKHASMFFGLF